jgi:hypothetical protein
VRVRGILGFEFVEIVVARYSITFMNFNYSILVGTYHSSEYLGQDPPLLEVEMLSCKFN